ncbi:crossover junction endodeoxyribonuclease RuvC [candidate division TM6 bacterium RIFCSPHIGHO2_12_FULL_38_8]|nr:MAG: crossover junction endodeoxyribonuclease RuvC [candidate division TM6 bacterium RIFCSPHIGHO2_12_FULL_38_8]
MIVLGIDPSFTATGYAIMAQVGNKQQLLHYGSVALPANLILSDRIGIFYEVLKNLIEKYCVTKISLETPFLGKNAQIFLKLGYLRGVVHLLAHQHKVSIVEFSPREVKLAVTGFGGAEKDQIARMIGMLFPGLIAQKSNDVTDAIAISLCGLWKQTSSSLKIQ